MKKWLLILPLSVFIQVSASSNDPGAANPEAPSYAIPSPGVYQSTYNTYGFAEFLYWKVHEDGLAWAASQTANLSVPASRATAEPLWDWKPGFRVGVGHLFKRDSWDLSLAYTWYYSKAKNSKRFNQDTNVAFGLFDTNPSGSGHAHWNLHYNTLDLALKKPFYIGTKVILNPALGLFAAWTSEKYAIDNVLPGTPPLASNHVTNKQRLSGIGPKTSLASTWNLSDYWSIFGEGSLAFLWGHYHITRHDTNNNGLGNITVVANLKNTFDTIRLVPSYSMGFKWNKPIRNTWLYFKAVWEQQVWLQYNQLFLLSVQNDNTLLFNNTNLSFYGLTLTGGVQF